MRNATRGLVSTFGGFVGLMGVEHGIGGVLQGSRPPTGLIILSWPDSAFFSILGGEPALTIIPNLLITGLLAILVSLIFAVWAVLFVQCKHGGRVLILLSIPMLLFGAGLFPPVLGVLIGSAATRLHAPLTWWQRRLPTGLRGFLMAVWPCSFGACLAAWLGMFPGVPVLNYFFGVHDESLIFILLYCMFGCLFLTGVAGFARDTAGREGSTSGV